MILENFSLKGKTAVVTGGGRGIGAAIALALAEAGADIVLADLLEDQMVETAGKIKTLGRKAVQVVTNVTDTKQVQALMDKAIAEYGKVDILVNNAGTQVIKPVSALPPFESIYTKNMPGFLNGMSDEEYARVMDVNMKSVFLCCRAIGPHMIARKAGKVINLSSIGSIRGSAYRAAYTASKAGVMMFTKSLALEWGYYHINVNAIAPGTFKTAMTAWFSSDPKGEESMIKRIPLKRQGRLEELGMLAIFLASGASDYMTGQTLYLDGGETL
jgi:NAD(P)-dependent dehydrogenase (short-subunit alcohol dehydrogenase family)